MFADTDMLSDFLWVRAQNFFGQRLAQAWASNGDLVQNALDNLAGSADLISVRGRATFTRPFERVEKLRRAANERFRAKEQELEQQLQRDRGEAHGAAEPRARSKSGTLIVTPEQEQEIEHFQAEKLRIRKELRAGARRVSTRTSTAWATTLKVINIVVVPFLFALVALGVALWRRQRRRAAHGDGGHPMTARRVAWLLVAATRRHRLCDLAVVAAAPGARHARR